jgi:hypothetical protein
MAQRDTDILGKTFGHRLHLLHSAALLGHMQALLRACR